MKLTKFKELFAFALLAGLLTFPLAGCGVESEPIGVDEDDTAAIEEDPEYIEGESGT
ncbi:hypothetical protein [Roseimaritima ulvae]|uniref:Uncharacterized protein n=1 Tax=Roseimaritima ulvae TaxID=980254 RepID=A0A5B9QH54_9BACT|nr:hypothetical protein [Roseimaritima ulvae]QEG38154.1 hypothetical protein UC8_01070 [Roseimaritima ulvae]